jgi:trimethylamine--corrinoid protein Co-methyltransferase
MLTEAQVEQVHNATLEVLEETGVTMENTRALKFLEEKGCKVDHEAMRVRFPRKIVEECMAQVPSSYEAKAPDSENNLHVGGNRLYFTHTSGMQSIDIDNFEQKVPSRQEYIDAVRVLEELPTIDQLGCYPYFGYEGVDSKMAIPEGVLLHFKYCSKHQAAACSNDCEIFTIQMAQALGQEFSATIGSSPPLTWGEKAIEAAFRIADSGFPLSTVDGAMMGGTGPATPVGSVIVSNAEQLAIIVLMQLLSPGHRVMIGHFSAPLNMKTGSPAFGQIGASISNVIFNQMWRHYGIPFSNGSPGYVNAKTIDYQAGYEKGIAGMISGLSGVNSMLLHFGVSSEVTAHPVQAVLDDDIARMIGRFLKGEEINEEALATELIKEVGPIPGHFLSKPHTMKWFRKEQCVPKSADTLAYADWVQKGKKTAMDFARERMEKLLEGGEKTFITASQEEDLRKILAEAQKYYSEQDA